MQIFRTGTLSGSAAAAKNLRIFRKNGSHVWGVALAPLCIERNGFLLIGHARQLLT